MVYKAMKASGQKVEAFIDNSLEAQGRDYDGVPIKAPEGYRGTAELVVIAIVGLLRSALDDLQRLSIENYAPYTSVVPPEAFQGADVETARMNALEMRRIMSAFKNKTLSEIELFSVDFVITEVCTLRCRDCANLMQYFSRPREADFAQTITAFKKLYSVCGWIDEVRVIGGDAMAAKSLPEYIKFLSGLKNISEIVIYTNGILMPKLELLLAITDKRVSFHVTEYGHSRQKIGELERILSEHDTRLRIMHIDEWQDCAKVYKRNRNDDELRDVFRQCCVVGIPSLKDGKLWRCPLAASLAALNAMPNTQRQCVDLTTDAPDDVIRTEIKKLMSLDFLYACDYCGGRPRVNTTPVPPAVQVARPLPYVEVSDGAIFERV